MIIDDVATGIWCCDIVCKCVVVTFLDVSYKKTDDGVFIVDIGVYSVHKDYYTMLVMVDMRNHKYVTSNLFLYSFALYSTLLPPYILFLHAYSFFFFILYLAE